MSEPTEQYRSIDLNSRARKQAMRVWLIGLSAVFVWTSLIIAAPAALSNGFSSLSTPIYSLYSFACHQLGERSLHLGGEPFAVCSRCFGVYFGLLTGFAIYPLWRNITDIDPLPRFWLFLSLIPITIDWLLTLFGIWENTDLSRLITGMILGVACATFIIPALVEVTRRLTMSSRRSVAS